jgi:hypothetical protein
MKYGVDKIVPEAPLISLDEIRGVFARCVESGYHSSLVEVLHTARIQIDDRPTSGCLGIGALVFAVVAAVMTIAGLNLGLETRVVACVPLTYAILWAIVLLLYLRGRAVDRLDRQDNLLIEQWTRDAIAQIVQSAHFELKPLPLRDYLFLKGLARREPEFRGTVSPLLALGPEQSRTDFSNLDV